MPRYSSLTNGIQTSTPTPIPSQLRLWFQCKGCLGDLSGLRWCHRDTACSRTSSWWLVKGESSPGFVTCVSIKIIARKKSYCLFRCQGSGVSARFTPWNHIPASVEHLDPFVRNKNCYWPLELKDLWNLVSGAAVQRRAPVRALNAIDAYNRILFHSPSGRGSPRLESQWYTLLCSLDTIRSFPAVIVA